MLLVDHCVDFVAWLEAGDIFTDGEDGAGAVGAGDYVGSNRDGIDSVYDDEIAGLMALVNRERGS